MVEVEAQLNQTVAPEEVIQADVEAVIDAASCRGTRAGHRTPASQAERSLKLSRAGVAREDLVERCRDHRQLPLGLEDHMGLVSPSAGGAATCVAAGTTPSAALPAASEKVSGTRAGWGGSRRLAEQIEIGEEVLVRRAVEALDHDLGVAREDAHQRIAKIALTSPFQSGA